MLERFLNSLSKLVADPQGHRYLLAVSGGADSCVMAHLFREAGLDFAIAHCNFHLRGEDSNHDMQLVENLAATWNVVLLEKEFDTLELQKNSGKSIEMVARDLRYAWFEEIGREYDYIATAHQADDAAETLLLNLCRGGALKAMLSIPAQNGRIIRPMLPFSAQEIRNYAQSNRIPFAIDCTNTDESIKRNRIRAAVIPILKELNPNLLDTLARNREILRQQSAFYQSCMAEHKKLLVAERDGTIIINAQKLRGMEHREIVLYEILSEYGFNAATASELCKNVNPTGTKHASPTHTLLVNRDEYLIRSSDSPKPEPVIIPSMEVLQQYFTVEHFRHDGHLVFEKDNRTLYLDEKKLSFPIVIRTWENGDFFYPLGSNGKQKISDFFTDHKFDRFTKDHTLLLEMNHDIVWIIGHRTDNRYKIDPKKTTHYYKLSYNGSF